MVQRIQVTLTDDLAGDDTPADDTVVFGLDGTEFEIDLSSENADALRGVLLDYAHKGRRVSRDGRKKTTRTSASARDIREWAATQGLDVPDRGRLPAEMRARFETAKK